MPIAREVTIEQLKQIILRLLARRDHSLRELQQKLRQKGYPADKIATGLDWLKQTDLINERRFTENFIRMRCKKGYGPDWISQELHAKGLPPEIIAEHLEMPDNAWFTEVRKVWQKKFKGKQPTNFKEKAKQMRFLQYRGYRQAHIDSLFEKDL